MESKKYDNYLIREDGLVLNNKTNKIVKGSISDFGDVIINSGSGNEMLKNIVARLFFDFDINFLNRIKVGHLDHNKQNNSVENLKIYDSKDKFNKSGKYIILFAEEYLVFHRKGLISKHKDLRNAFNNLL